MSCWGPGHQPDLHIHRLASNWDAGLDASLKIHHCKVKGTDLNSDHSLPQTQRYCSEPFVHGRASFMKFFLVLPILLMTSVSYGQAPAPVEENKLPVVVVSANWLRDRHAGNKAVQSAMSPARGMTK